MTELVASSGNPASIMINATGLVHNDIINRTGNLIRDTRFPRTHQGFRMQSCEQPLQIASPADYIQIMRHARLPACILMASRTDTAISITSVGDNTRPHATKREMLLASTTKLQLFKHYFVCVGGLIPPHRCKPLGGVCGGGLPGTS